MSLVLFNLGENGLDLIELTFCGQQLLTHGTLAIVRFIDLRTRQREILEELLLISKSFHFSTPQFVLELTVDDANGCVRSFD